MKFEFFLADIFDNWKVIAAIPPIAIWVLLFAYLRRVDSRVAKAEALLKEELDRRKSEA